MAIRTLKLFVVGPHDTSRYELIRTYIRKVVDEREDADDLDVSIISPEQNPSSDRFNDWIFAQIDTCDLLVADVTGFNPNVIYEVAFAHTLGVPCAYLRFGKTDGTDEEEIKHYFKFALLPTVTEDQLEAGRNSDFDGQLEALFDGKPVSGENILSDYYLGVSPVDSEFVRGLVTGYWRNFLERFLYEDLGHGKPLQKPSAYAKFKQFLVKKVFGRHPTIVSPSLRILIPDTFELSDADVRRAAENRLGKDKRPINRDENGRPLGNSMGREFTVNYAEKAEAPFFFDIPTTLLTITQSSKYLKVDKAHYFDEVDRDRLTDRLARRFAAALWELIRANRHQIEWPLDRLEIVWLSDAIGPWTENEALMNTDPIPRPEGL